MPVVRELINRISFKVNPGDKKNAEKAFSDMKGGAAGVIGVAKGLTGAFGLALKAVGMLTAAGTAMRVEFEKNRAVSRFFSRSTEEAQQLSDIVDKIRGNPIISRRELEQAKASLSKLTVDLTQIDNILPLLAEVTVARPDLDFSQVIALITEFTKTGDINALEKIGAVGKDTAEAFRLAQMNTEQAIKGQQNLFAFISQGLQDNKEKIKENADAVRKDLGYALKEVSRESSDFAFTYGEKTLPAIKEATLAARDLMKELNASKPLWDKIDSSVSGIVNTLQLARKFVDSPLENLPEVAKTMLTPMVPGGGLIKEQLDKLPSPTIEQYKEGVFKEQNEQMIKTGGVAGAVKSLLELTGVIEIKGSGNLEGKDFQDMKRALNEDIKKSLRNVAAANNQLVPTGGL